MRTIGTDSETRLAISTPVGSFTSPAYISDTFPQGAMENWGLITGRTTAFLLDPEKADLSAKKNVMATQSHEVAHMWLVELGNKFDSLVHFP